MANIVKKYSIADLVAVAQKHTVAKKGRPYKMTQEILDAAIALRKRKFSMRAIHETLKELGISTFKSAQTFAISYKIATK